MDRRDRPTLLVTGASGFLGAHLLRAAAPDWTVAGTFCSGPGLGAPAAEAVRLDVTDRDAVLRVVDAVAPSAILHAAAFASWKACEDHPDIARLVNADGTRHVAEAARRVGARLVHISTDLVFDGAGPAYDERSRPRPICAYGRTKLEAEDAALAGADGSCVVRISLTFGWSRNGSANFVETILRTVRTGRDLPCFVDEHRTPVSAAETAADLLEFVSRRDLCGTFHLGGGERVSRHELAIRVCRAFDLPERRIVPCRVDDVFPGLSRPRDASLADAATRRTLGRPAVPLDDALSALRRSEPGGPAGH